MAISVQYDEVEGSYLTTRKGGVIRRTRAGRIRGIPVSGTLAAPDSRVLEKALEQLPLYDTDYPPGDGQDISGLKLVGHVLTPSRFDIIRFQLVYETEVNAFTPFTSWLLRVSTRLVQERTNMIPGSRIPIRVAWQDDIDPELFVPEDYLTIEYERPHRIISLTSNTLNEPELGPSNLVGRVNDATWYGYPKGYVRIRSYDADTSDSGANWQQTAELETKIDEDWSVWGILQNKNTGRFVKVADEDISTVLAMAYIYGTTDIVNSGFIRVGPHKLTNFSSLFNIPSP
jgi:hypothetical protein